MNKAVQNITRDVLLDLYVIQGISMKDISKILGCSVGLVYNRIKSYEIPTRPFRTFNERARNKMSESNKRRVVSEETRKKLSLANKGRKAKRGFIHKSRFGGHTKKGNDGYVRVYVPSHPHATKDGYVMEHILVMEEHIGKYIESGYVVHHKNMVRNDNRIENLEIMSVHDHMSFHAKERWNKWRNERRLKNAQ